MKRSIQVINYLRSIANNQDQPVETNPENTHSHKIAHISSPKDDKSNLQKV